MGTRQTDNRLSYWLETPKAARSPCQSVSSGTSLRLGQEGGEEGGMMKDITKKEKKNALYMCMEPFFSIDGFICILFRISHYLKYLGRG